MGCLGELARVFEAPRSPAGLAGRGMRSLLRFNFSGASLELLKMAKPERSEGLYHWKVQFYSIATPLFDLDFNTPLVGLYDLSGHGKV